MSDLDEKRFLQLADQAFRRLQDALEPVDPDDADYDFTGDVLTITFGGGGKCIVNTQRPTRQLWVAAHSRAWHFDWDPATGRWLDDKGTGTELFELLRRIVKESAGADLALPT